MSGSFRIAHISDLHLSTIPLRETTGKVRQLLELLARKRVDHLVVTGDLTADGQLDELNLFRALLARFDLLDPARVSVVIGNHDIFGGVHLAEDVFEFPERCRTIPYQERVRQFAEALPELFKQSMVANRYSPFPYIKPLGPILLVGVNSVAEYSKLKNPLGSNGEVDDEQFDKLAVLFSLKGVRKYPKIVAIHHHFSKGEFDGSGAMRSVWSAIEMQTMRMRKKGRLLNLFRKNDVRMILHGHVHTTTMYERKGILCSNAGGSVLGPEKSLVTANIIEMDGKRMFLQMASTEVPANDIPAVMQRLAPSLPENGPMDRIARTDGKRLEGIPHGVDVDEEQMVSSV